MVAVPSDDRISGKSLIAACPLYLKSHSMGEFVFDHGWADAAERSGISYYPKLLVGVPFTPHTGRRFLIAPGVARRPMVAVLGRALMQLCADNKLSSVHVNFCLADEAAALRELGFLERARLPVPLAQQRLHDLRRLPGRAQEQAPLRGPP